MSEALLFEAVGIHFAVPASCVRELVELPSISGWPAPPAGCLGVIDYRGRVVPVVDVSLLLGGPAQERTLTHQLLVLCENEDWIAILIEVAHDLLTLEGCVPDESPTTGVLSRAKQFVKGVTRLKGRVVLELDVQAVLASLGEHSVPDILPVPIPHKERDELLESRAIHLSKRVELAENETRQHLLVVNLGGEKLGFEVKDVREIIPHPKWTPVPGTPDHLTGLCYHRGELVRVVDIRHKRGLPIESTRFENLIIVNCPGMLTGISVESIDAVIAAEIDKGQAYHSGWVSVLDLDELEIGEPQTLDRR